MEHQSQDSEFSPEKAFAVVRGNRIFYARCVVKPSGVYVPKGVKVYDPNGNERIGPIQPTDRWLGLSLPLNTVNLEGRLDAESEITKDLIQKLELGDYVLVRQVSDVRFEPIVNFREDDDAYDPNGNQLVTEVEGYNRRDMIHHLPILSLREDIRSDGFLGVGHVKRPERKCAQFYYKPVFVIGAIGDVGKYVEAEIISNGKKIILAEKVG